MTKHKKWLLPILFLLAFLTILFFPKQEIAALSPDSNYRFSAYKTEIDLKEDKTMDITETMDIYYLQSHINVGVIRDIQRLSKTTRVLDKKAKHGKTYIANISNIVVTINGTPAYFETETYDNGQFHSILIGKEGEYLSAGKHQIVLSYTYDMSDDYAADFDDFTYDLYGYAMKPTDKFEAIIHFPKSINKDQVTVRTGYSALPSNKFSITGNTCTITADTTYGLTLQAIMEKGYFTKNTPNFYWYYILFATLAALAMLFTVLLFFKNKKQAPTITKKVYPPPNITVLEAALYYKGKCTFKDLGLLILKWQQEGYLSIQSYDGTGHCTITKCKELKRASILDKAYFNALFKEGDVFNTKASAYENLPTKQALYDVGKQIVNKTNRSLLDIHRSTRICFGMLSCLPFVFMYIYFSILRGVLAFSFLCIFTILGTFIAHSLFRTNKFLAVCMYVMFSLPPVIVTAIMQYIPQYDYAGLLYTTILFGILALVVTDKIGKRPKEHQQMYSDLMSVRHFVLNTPKEEMETFLESDKDYMDIMFPFLVAIDVNKKFAKQLQKLEVKPTLYQPYLPYYMGCSHMLRRFYYCSSFYARPSSSSHSGSSFGGGGGGGFGGSRGGGGGGGGSRGR